MEKLISGPLARVLKSERERFNGKFARAKQAMPQLDEQALGAFLREALQPIAEAVDGFAPARTGPVADFLFDAALSFVGKGFAKRYPRVMQGWKILLSTFPALLCEDPLRFSSSIGNALLNLSSVEGARPTVWVETMFFAGGECANLDEFLEAGKVAAWLCGMAHYRRSALDACSKLRPKLALAVLGLPRTTDEAALAATLGNLRADPWHPIAPSPPETEKRLKIVARAGSFHGFGGVIAWPPLVGLDGEDFLVFDGTDCWTLAADRFGATFQRTTPPSDGQASAGGNSGSVDAKGWVAFRGLQQQFPELVKSTSSAVNGPTLAITVPSSHSVFLVAAV